MHFDPVAVILPFNLYAYFFCHAVITKTKIAIAAMLFKPAKNKGLNNKNPVLFVEKVVFAYLSFCKNSAFLRRLISTLCPCFNST